MSGQSFQKSSPTLPETNIAHENPPFWWYLPGYMGIFMGYVSLPEGKWWFNGDDFHGKK